MIKTNYMEIAKITGFTPETVRRIMKGETQPNAKTAFSISDAVGINVVFLFNHPDGLTPDQVIQNRWAETKEPA